MDVVAQDDVQIVNSHAMQTHVDTFDNSLGRKIKMVDVVTTEFAAQQVVVAWHIFQCDAEQYFRHATTVIGRSVDEVHSKFQCYTNTGKDLIKVHITKFSSQRGSAKAENG